MGSKWCVFGIQHINSNPPTLSNLGKFAIRIFLNSCGEQSTSAMQIVFSPRPALTSISFLSTLQGTLLLLLLSKPTNLPVQAVSFALFGGGRVWKWPPLFLFFFTPPSKYGAKFARCSCLVSCLVSSLLQYNGAFSVLLVAIPVYCAVQLQLDCVQWKCLRTLQYVFTLQQYITKSNKTKSNSVAIDYFAWQ